MNTLSAEVLLRHDARIRALARELLADENGVEDVAQQTWLAAIQRSPQQPGSLGAWLASIARNFALRSFRSTARRRQHEQHAARPETVPSTEEILEREETRRAVVLAVLRLPEPHRSTTVLRYFEGLPPRVIARQLGVPVETVRSRLKRAHAELRIALARDHGGEGRSLSRMLVPLAGPAAWSAPFGASSLLGALVMTAKTKLLIAAVILIGIGAPIALWHFRNQSTEAVLQRSPEVGGLDEPATDAAAVAKAASPTQGDEAAPVRTIVPASEPAAPAVPPSLENGSLLVRALWQESKTPAQGISVIVLAPGRPDPYFNARSATTGAEGTVRIEELPPASYSVLLSRGEQHAKALVEAGAEKEVVFEIPPCITVEGIVVDGSGHPVQDAAIFLLPGGLSALSLDAGPVAFSSAEGTFSLEGITEGSEISARAKGYASSRCNWIIGSAGSRQRIRLVLDRRGGEVDGRVLDPAGDPVPQALVRLTLAKWDGYHTTEDGFIGNVCEVAARSDEEGRFAFSSVPAGTLPIAARASGYGTWRGSVDVSLQRATQLDIYLEFPAEVSGLITTADGKAAQGVRVQVGRYWDPMSSAAKTDSEGRFLLEEVAPGEIHIEADGEERGKASGTVFASSGEEARWDAVLSAGLQILGRVVDDSDSPIAGCVSWARPMRPEDVEGEFYERDGKSDATGRFVIKNVKEVPHLVELLVPGCRISPASQRNVVPGQGEVLFRIPRDYLSPATITGIVTDSEGKPLANIHVSASHATLGSSGMVSTQSDTGRFTLDRLPCGTYRLRFMALGRPDFLTPPHDVSPGERWDAGEIRFPVPGRLIVHLRREAGAPGSDPYLVLSSLDGHAPAHMLEPHGDTASSQPVVPGRYALTVTGPDIAHSRHVVEVRAEETTELEVLLRAGYQKTLRLHLEGEELPTAVHVVLSNAAGESIAEYDVHAFETVYDLVVSLCPGHYQVEATTRSGRRTTSELEIDASSSAADVVEIW
ncbi:MAG: sigma-70 family RNA polymerase sigma factor [Planctomycetota bacterium]